MGTVGEVRAPQEVGDLRGLRVAQVGCGRVHSAALVEDPEEGVEENSAELEGLSTVGWRSTEALAERAEHGVRGAQGVAWGVEMPEGQVAGGGECGGGGGGGSGGRLVLLTWGVGANGRLGLGSARDEGSPVVVEALEGLQVLQVSCGLDHTLVLARPVRPSGGS